MSILSSNDVPVNLQSFPLVPYKCMYVCMYVCTCMYVSIMCMYVYVCRYVCK